MIPGRFVAPREENKSEGRELRRIVAVRKDLPAHAISTKNKHLLLACATNPRFHGGCFGVWGTPPPKPLNCKVWQNHIGAGWRGVQRLHAPREPQLVRAGSVVCSVTSHDA